MRAFVPTALLALGVAAPALAQPQPMRIKTEKAEVVVETVARGLDHPWGAGLPARGALSGDRAPGAPAVVGANGTALGAALRACPESTRADRAGCSTCCLDPAFADNRIIYLCFSEDRGQGGPAQRWRGPGSERPHRARGSQVIFRQQPRTRHEPLRLAPRLRHATARSSSRSATASICATRRRIPPTTSARSCASSRTAALPPTIPCRPGWGAAGDLVDRPPQCPGRGAPSAHGKLWTAEHGARGGDEINIPRRAGTTAGR